VKKNRPVAKPKGNSKTDSAFVSAIEAFIEKQNAYLNRYEKQAERLRAACKEAGV
jgi:hypothetical protein